MKKLLAIITALILLTTISFAQTPHDIGKAAIQFNDSLYCGGTVTGDSVYTFNLAMRCDWIKIFIVGNSNSPVDTIRIKEGVNTISNLTSQYTGSTVWGSYVTLKDSALNTHNIMINNTVGKSYTIWNPAMGVYKMEFLNAWANLTTRRTSFVIICKLTPGQ